MSELTLKVKTDTTNVIAECQEVMAEVCNEWECDFLESIHEDVEDNGPGCLSERQLAKLEKIYTMVCESPH